MEPKLVADYLCETGEGPIWHSTARRLYWTDIPTGRMFWFDPETGQHQQFYEGASVGGFTVQKDGSLLLFMEKGAVATYRDGKLEYIIEEIPAERETRFNDVAADPRGRVFCGTMPAPDHPGTLYRLDLNGSITPVVENVAVSNGIGFTGDLKQMYFTDSPTHRIDIFDYDVSTGELSNRRPFVEIESNDGIPDGLTVDAEDPVWSARWDGSSLCRYTPTGELERRIWFPARKVSSLTFGGPDLTDIYVTTAGGPNRAAEGPGAGGLFRLDLGIRGRSEFLSGIGL